MKRLLLIAAIAVMSVTLFAKPDHDKPDKNDSYDKTDKSDKDAKYDNDKKDDDAPFDSRIEWNTTPVISMPEPATLMLLGASAVAAAGWIRLRSR